jgi:hypothetical protein
MLTHFEVDLRKIVPARRYAAGSAIARQGKAIATTLGRFFVSPIE